MIGGCSAMTCKRHMLRSVEPCAARCQAAFCCFLLTQNLMERAVTLGIAAGQQAASPALSQLLAQYSSLLAAQVRRQVPPCPLALVLLLSCCDEVTVNRSRVPVLCCWLAPSTAAKT